MLSSLPCKHCNKSLAECREADKQLITPFNPSISALDNPIQSMYIPRLSRTVVALNYKLGCYDPVTQQLYQYNRNILSSRSINDMFLTLPICVLNNESDWYVKYKRISVIKKNLNSLPLEEDYFTILKQL